ncbi:MAG: hypothetical protein ACD_22C00251G0003 [uncultured bacterium]|nr:MAG: hypothetical protein ACD_22C00251G0003 [uncultured bacterium]
MLDIETIKKLREDTGAAILDVKQTLQKYDGDVEKTRKELMEKGMAKAAKKQEERTTKDGLVHAYIHGTGRVGSIVVLACETDFVAKTDDFIKLIHEIAMQVAGDDYKTLDDLLNAEYIRDGSKKISDLISETIAKVGEKIEIKDFKRMNVN